MGNSLKHFIELAANHTGEIGDYGNGPTITYYNIERGV